MYYLTDVQYSFFYAASKKYKKK